MRSGPADGIMDRVFENEINKAVRDTDAAYSSMQFHSALVAGYYELANARDNYRSNLQVPLNWCALHACSLTLMFVVAGTW
jgi:hypothetical protein